jgi:pimeloyl-ACP methyl ester carboxylesterase
MSPNRKPLKVILLHGWGGSGADTFGAHGWPDLLKGIDRTAIALDLPGHGTEANDHDPESYRDLGIQTLALLPPDPVDVIGFSLGAKLMLDMALRAPERFGTLIAGGIGDNIFAPEPVSEDAVRWLTASDPRAAPMPLGAVIASVLDQGRDPLALAAILRRPPNPRFDEERLARLGPPLHVIVGDSDSIAGRSDRLRTALPSLREIRLPGVAHFDLTAAPAFKAAVAHILEPTFRLPPFEQLMRSSS